MSQDQWHKTRGAKQNTSHARQESIHSLHLPSGIIKTHLTEDILSVHAHKTQNVACNSQAVSVANRTVAGSPTQSVVIDGVGDGLVDEVPEFKPHESWGTIFSGGMEFGRPGRASRRKGPTAKRGWGLVLACTEYGGGGSCRVTLKHAPALSCSGTSFNVRARNRQCIRQVTKSIETTLHKLVALHAHLRLQTWPFFHDGADYLIASGEQKLAVHYVRTHSPTVLQRTLLLRNAPRDGVNAAMCWDNFSKRFLDIPKASIGILTFSPILPRLSVEGRANLANPVDMLTSPTYILVSENNLPASRSTCITKCDNAQKAAGCFIDALIHVFWLTDFVGGKGVVSTANLALVATTCVVARTKAVLGEVHVFWRTPGYREKTQKTAG